jgi:hypothetical protein
MGAGLVRVLAVASCLPVAAAALAMPSSAAPIARPISIPTPNARTTAFEACMNVAATPPRGVSATVSPPVLRAAAAPATPAVPSAARCLALMGLADVPRLRVQTTLCLSQRGLARTICLNAVFDATAPVSVASPGPTPTASPPPPPPTATPRPTPPPTGRPTRRPTPTPQPTATPTPQATATPTPAPTRTPAPTPEKTDAPPPTSAPTASPRTPTPAVVAATTPAPSTPPSPTATPPLALFPIDVSTTALAAGGAGIALAAVGGAVLIRNRRRQKGQPQMHRLTIAAPGDGSIAVAGSPVTFTAHTEPPTLASKIAWSVTTQPNVHGIGPTFTHTFAATGVEQVVARLGDDALACDVIVYVFKTPSGGSTFADVLRAEPPPAARSAESFTRYGTTAAAPGKAS